MKRENHDILQSAKNMHDESVRLRRDIHMHPESGFNVHRTAKLVSAELRSYGLCTKEAVGKTGVIGDLTTPGATRTIALRAEMDALPIEELNDVPYRSTIPGVSHMCGHDAHTAMLLGAANILSEMRDKVKVNVRFIFQPNEEVFPGGAQSMIEDGAIEGVDEIYALHVWPTLEVGHYGICVGYAMAQPDAFEIIVTGRGGHAATPHTTIDPIPIAAQIIIVLQTIISRQIDSTDSAVISVTQINAGTAFNVIPNECFILGTVRTYEKETQQFIRQKIEKIARGIAETYGAEVEFKYSEGYPATYNHQDQACYAKKVALSLVTENRLNFPAKKMMYGEDFSYFTNVIPGCYIHLGCRNEAKGFTAQVHHPRFDIDEDCLIYGIAMHVGLILNQT